MSQYRTEDADRHSPGEIKSPRELQHNPSHLELVSKVENQNVSNHPHTFASNQTCSDYTEEYVIKSTSQEYSANKQSTTEFPSKVSEFSASKQLEAYTKQLHPETDRLHQNDGDENYAIAKMEPRHTHNLPGPVAFSGQPRFVSGQSVTQPAGPTPTLNQLLQASSPVHRFHSSYSSLGPESYQQPWPVQRPSVVPQNFSQTNQRPPQTGSPRLHHGPGGPNTPSSMPYQSYNQRFSSPARSHSPYSHHQLNSYGVPPANIYSDQRTWNSSSSSTNSPVLPASNQTNSSSQSPQRALSQSPAPPPSASPQPQNIVQPQNFHGMQPRSTTPNTQGIDSGELSGQNSNDSSNGPANPATPNSQGMRPTPSPTGSTGSRSMSPAVGQQTVQMPPRPSSSQSDSGGPARICLSPLAAQAQGDDSTLIPKIRKELLNYHNHPATTQSVGLSPNVPSLSSMHEDYPDMNAQGWPRTAASPVFSSHVSQDPYRAKKSDSLSKLYEMDDSMERRSWLDKLVSFMEERRTPITSCPTISKNPLDLFRLYLYVKERGGFMEVCKVTKNKIWKDVAGLLGIGASSSAAYTLRKHYTKHLLAYECHFDRGGVDPQPIINQVEAGSKKKGTKNSSSVPSPGSSNSQDSFPAGGSSNTSIDGYSNFQGTYTANASNNPTAEYNPPPPRPPSQSGSSSHQSIQQGNYQSTTSFQNYSQDQSIRTYGSAITQQSEFNQSYSPRTHYTTYVGDIERNYAPPNNAASQDVYNRFNANQQTGTFSSGTPPGTRNTFPMTTQGHSVNAQQSPSSQHVTQQPQSVPGTTYPCPQDYYRQEGTYGPSLGSQLYSSSGALNKNMPPPAPQQPRRHPDFVKEQQFSSYNQQRTPYPGWQSGSNQYNSGTPVRMQYSSQSTQSSSHQQSQQAQTSPNSPGSSNVSTNNTSHWNSHANARSSTQSNVNSPTHVSTSWDHRYNPSPSLYSTPGTQQNQLGISSVISQQSIAKRELTFPIDSIEAITPLLYKRRKLNRADIAPVEAWRIMMALRSGLLAESCWALDVLNILLFDDTSVHYFGLAHLPGLLDVLLEHFSRSLSDMFDYASINDDEYYYPRRIRNFRLDLGAVTKPIDPKDHTTLLSSSNYTLSSRRGKPVKIVPKDDDIFILDSRRSWDLHDKETDVEPWQVDRNAIDYIVTCLESEMNSVSFISNSRNERLFTQKEELEFSDSQNTESLVSNPRFSENLSEISDGKFNILEPKELQEINIEHKQSQHEKKKKTKTLSDILSRIKKAPIEMNDLTREIFEKKNDNHKKECETGRQLATPAEELAIDSSSTEVHTDDKPSEMKDQRLKGDIENNSMFSMNIPELSKSQENLIENSTHEDDNKQNRSNHDTIDDKKQKEGLNIRETPKLRIQDPAGTLKRRRISDFEDESYSRDEASLYLVTETQDNVARRCVCLSTILRNLSFIPGNELEFARNITFLSLLGKLLLLYHEHPTRTQKTRNYDREEDADFVDSCSSLQGESEWWWDFLYHIRENILVMAANIAGYTDLSQYPEEISRPVLDGLLHWAICPAAHGQDPFPTVNLNSSLSPQRLALEALCKLCVTESNVDLVVATPPYSRLQKLCSVLSRLLCRSEEQVLREFGINLLHFLSAADSGVARTIALQTPCVALLVTFIEQAENSALSVVNQHGIAALRDNPESMGTSLDMLRRAAGTLLNLSRHPENRTLLLQHESRLLALVMSQILDQQVAAIIARVLFQCSRVTT